MGGTKKDIGKKVEKEVAAVKRAAGGKKIGGQGGPYSSWHKSRQTSDGEEGSQASGEKKEKRGKMVGGKKLKRPKIRRL